MGCGVKTLVCSIIVVWAPSRGGNSSIGRYRLKVVGGMSRLEQIEGRVVQKDGKGVVGGTSVGGEGKDGLVGESRVLLLALMLP